jgi:hypothetical protein
VSVVRLGIIATEQDDVVDNPQSQFLERHSDRGMVVQRARNPERAFIFENPHACGYPLAIEGVQVFDLIPRAFIALFGASRAACQEPAA